MKTIVFYSQILSKSLREKIIKILFKECTLPTSSHPPVHPETSLQQTLPENNLHFDTQLRC